MTRRGFSLGVLAVAVAACGGGGGGDDAAGPAVQAPPATAAALTQSSAEAMAAVQALDSSTSVLLRKRTALQGGSLFAPLGASSSPANLRNSVARGAREQALARETATCSELGLSACSGSVTFDYNFDDEASVLPAGTYVAVRFNALSGNYAGSAFSMDGTFRMEFLTALDIDAMNFANACFQVTLDSFTGTAEGVSFGPETSAALYEFDTEGVPAVTIDGLRIRGLDNMLVSNDSNYTLNDFDLRTTYWGGATTYVDVDFSNWTVASGRPTNASTAIISAGANASIGIGIVVQSSSQGQVVYSVRVTAGGVFTDYLVTATYTNNVPSYSSTT